MQLFASIYIIFWSAFDPATLQKYIQKYSQKSINVALIAHRFGDGFGYDFWCFCDTFSVRTRNLLNLQRHLLLQWIWMILPFRETLFWWFSWSFSLPTLAMIFDEFWHRFCRHVGIYFWHPVPCFRVDRFILMIWGISILLILIKNASKKKMLGLSFFVTFRDICPHTSTFYVGKTYKYQKPWDLNLFHPKQNVLRTCTFYLRKTYKCAVTVFTVLTNKKSTWKS